MTWNSRKMEMGLATRRTNMNNLLKVKFTTMKRSRRRCLTRAVTRTLPVPMFRTRHPQVNDYSVLLCFDFRFSNSPFHFSQ